LPLQRSFLPSVNITYHKDEYKNHHLNKAEKLKLFIGYRPRIEENDFYIEEDEEKGIQIVAEIELNPGLANGDVTAFIGGAFDRVRIIGASTEIT